MNVNPAILMKKLNIDAENGDLSAQSRLALLYYKGEQFGIKSEYDKARKWALIAAKRGDAQAQTVLGNLYREGLGGSQDYDQAIFWLEKAVAQGDFLAQIGLALAKAKR